jgi:hypothetical protein
MEESFSACLMDILKQHCTENRKSWAMAGQMGL